VELHIPKDPEAHQHIRRSWFYQIHRKTRQGLEESQKEQHAAEEKETGVQDVRRTVQGPGQKGYPTEDEEVGKFREPFDDVPGKKGDGDQGQQVDEKEWRLRNGQDIKRQTHDQSFQRSRQLGMEARIHAVLVRPEIGPGLGRVTFQPDQVCLKGVILDRVGTEECQGQPEEGPKNIKEQKKQDEFCFVGHDFLSSIIHHRFHKQQTLFSHR
jgi:hypothetical protein